MIKKRLLALMKESKKYLVYNVVWQWLAMLTSAVTMFLAGHLVEQAWNRQLTGGRIAGAAAVILVAVGIRMVCSRQAAKASYLAGSEVKKRLRRELYGKLQSLGASYHEKVPTAEAVQVAVEGVEQLEVYFGKYLPQLFYSILAPITLFVLLSFVDFRASLVLLVCVPLIPIIIMVVQKFARRLLDKYWGIYTELGDSFLENLQGLTTLKIYQADEQKAAEMDVEAEHFRKITMKVLMMQLNSIIVMDLVAYGGAAAGVIVTLLELGAGRVGIGGALTIILLSVEFFVPMRMLGSFFHIAMNGMTASDKLFAILDIPEADKGTARLESGTIRTELAGLCYSYEPGRRVLCDITLEIPEKGMVSLVGQSGCGKSTIAGLLTGRNKGYEGSISLNDRELSDISEESLMSHVTLVSHNSYLFKGTVEDNLRMAAPGASKERLLEVLREVNLYEELADRDGLATQVAERGSNLSGGQCQRLAFARALLHDTPLYIFDEATSNIDAESEQLIMEVILKLAGKKAVLLISHRLANVVESEQIYVLKGGRIAERGTHEALLNQNGVYRELYLGQKELEKYAAKVPDVTVDAEAAVFIKAERRRDYA